MKRAIFGLFIAALLAACAPQTERGEAREVPEGAWRVDYDNSRLGFSGAQAGKSFDGEFGRFDAIIFFEPDDPGAARIEVEVDVSSARTGDRQRDSALPTRDWFYVREHPTARFTAGDVEQIARNAYVARGELTMRGVSHACVLDFTLDIENGKARAKGGTTLIRTDFGVGQGEFETDEWIGFEVAVDFEIVASR